MQQLVLRSSVMVQRSLVAIIVVPMLGLMTFVALWAVTIADLEFSYAIGVSDNPYTYRIVDHYRTGYGLWWAGPAVAAIWACILVWKRSCRLLTLVCYFNFVIAFVLLWSCLAISVFYLSNQSFWGWRRVIVGHEVFADKGFQSGYEPLTPSGDRLLPGELFDSKWGTNGGISVLRNIARPDDSQSTGEQGLGKKVRE